jgi:hypothetical protein
MNRTILVCTLLVAAGSALGAQTASQAGQSSPYQGTSKPPADDQIITSETPESKPSAARPMVSQPAEAAPEPISVSPRAEPSPRPADPAMSSLETGNDDGIVHVAASEPGSPQSSLTERADASDPDGDIVHPHVRRPGEIVEGTSIRVRLLERLSTASSEKDEPFRTTVASDVLQGGQVVIPAGAEIDGRVVEVSAGHAGGHGSMRLAPESVILPNGSRYKLYAGVTGTPGSRTHVVGENTIVPDSRMKRDGIEYGAAVGAGLVTGAIVGGPAGALAGSLIGAGAITVHLLVSHPQATLETGTTLMFTLTEPLDMVSGTSSGN